MNEIVSEPDLTMQLQVLFDQQAVSGRELHRALGIRTKYTDWFPRMCRYGFIPGKDYSMIFTEGAGTRPVKDHLVSLDMAKQICMIQRTEVGKRCRAYLLSLEHRWNDPDALLDEAMRIATAKLEEIGIHKTKPKE